MDRERWARIQAVFHDVVERPPAEQNTLIDAGCADVPSIAADVRAMLDEDARGVSLLDGDVARLADDLLGSFDPQRIDPTWFRPYRLTSLLDRDDLGSRVAIKILKDGWLSPARRKRFALEARTLALRLLNRAIESNYCSYPAIESDPLLGRVRARPEYGAVRAAAIACRDAFLAERRR